MFFFPPVLLTLTYFTVLHGSGGCVRSMPYSNLMSAAKILRVADSVIHPVALCSHDYQIFPLHRAGPSTGLSRTLPETLPGGQNPRSHTNCREIKKLSELRRGQELTYTQVDCKKVCGKTWQGEKTWADSVRKKHRKQKGSCSLEQKE